MNTENIDLIFDLGPGDGGKGGVVQKMASCKNSHTILKVGGAQGSHGVTTENLHFSFSQWGCGTFDDIPTHITDLMVVDPEALLVEGEALSYHGVINPFDLLTVDENAICSTPYHGITSRISEIVLGDNPRGTIGSGVGQAYRRQFEKPDLVIKVGDLKTNLLNKLSDIRDYEYNLCLSLLKDVEVFGDDLEEVNYSLEAFKNSTLLYDICASFKQCGYIIKIVDRDYLINDIFNRGLNATIECSHGILTDNEFGFYPHVSALRTLPSIIMNRITEYGYTGNWNSIGVHRAYSIRHGAGPLPTYDKSMISKLLPNSHKLSNRWQGDVRTGALDFVLLRYAVDVVGYENINSIAVTWFDQIVKNGSWDICNRYSDYNPEYFIDGSRILHSTHRSLDSKSGFTNSIFNVHPVVETIQLPNDQELQFELCSELFKNNVGLPVSLVSFGPTKREKVLGV